jgi:hypothetical protein
VISLITKEKIMQLFILVEKNFPEWQEYEVHKDGKRILHTTDWNEVIKVLNGEMPCPTIVQVD